MTMRPTSDFFTSFRQVFPALTLAMKHNSETIHTEKWQGIGIDNNPAAAMKEIRYVNFCVDLEGREDISEYQATIEPNLPWAEDHFLERVCGEPLNPGQQWKNWPFAHSANGFRDEDGQFNHTYMERYWPRYAGLTDKGELKGTKYDFDHCGLADRYRNDDRHGGIRYRYGDLNDLVEQLHREPLTRQAYLPIFFPEDTGIANPDRKPCTLGYFFLMRNGKLDITYYIRSCDFMRHLRDDIYLTVRLMLWVLDRLREKNPTWETVTPGLFRMDIGSLHMFINDYIKFFGRR